MSVINCSTTSKSFKLIFFFLEIQKLKTSSQLFFSVSLLRSLLFFNGSWLCFKPRSLGIGTVFSFKEGGGIFVAAFKLEPAKCFVYK